MRFLSVIWRETNQLVPVLWSVIVIYCKQTNANADARPASTQLLYILEGRYQALRSMNIEVAWDGVMRIVGQLRRQRGYTQGFDGAEESSSHLQKAALTLKPRICSLGDG
jgi:hypothetical protein